MTEENKTVAEEGLRALRAFLLEYFLGNRHAWMHDVFGTEFDKGEAHALTGLALIPEVRRALDAFDDDSLTLDLGGSLEQWHKEFEPKERQ
jgi:hypothetical protein